MRIILLTLLWLAGVVLGAFLMVGDELIEFAQCCKGNLYPFPVIGSYPVWVSWEIVFGVLVLDFGIIILIIGFTRKQEIAS